MGWRCWSLGRVVLSFLGSGTPWTEGSARAWKAGSGAVHEGSIAPAPRTCALWRGRARTRDRRIMRSGKLSPGDGQPAPDLAIRLWLPSVCSRRVGGCCGHSADIDLGRRGSMRGSC
jgi:hypothetical protein